MHHFSQSNRIKGNRRGWFPKLSSIVSSQVQNVLCVTLARMPSDLDVCENAHSPKNMAFWGVRFPIECLLIRGVKWGQLNWKLGWGFACVVFAGWLCFQEESMQWCLWNTSRVCSKWKEPLSWHQHAPCIMQESHYLPRFPVSRPGRMWHLSFPRRPQYDHRWFGGWTQPALMLLPWGRFLWSSTFSWVPFSDREKSTAAFH